MRASCFVLVAVFLSVVTITTTTFKKKHLEKEVGIFFQLFLPKEKRTRHHGHSKHHRMEMERPPLKESRTASKQCKMTFLKSYDDCFEIGCTPGKPCRAKELKGFECCSHVFRGKLISCCKGNYTCPSVPKMTVAKEKTQGSKPPAPKGCPAQLIPPNYNCMEMGCIEGEPCHVSDMTDHKCCAHVTSKGTKVTCCLSDPAYDLSKSYLKFYRFKRVVPESMHPNSSYWEELQRHPRSVGRCPPKPFIPQFHCMQIECNIGEQCLSKTLQDRKCCPHVFEGQEISCCLGVPIMRTYSPRFKFPCPNITEGIKYDCLEIGCEFGRACANDEEDRCCQLKYKDMSARCCLSPSSLRTKQSMMETPTDNLCFSHPDRDYNCFSVGCEIGTKCTKIGRSQDECCVYIYQGVESTCCLVEVEPINGQNQTNRGDVLHSPTNSERCLSMSPDETYDCLAIGCTEGTSCVSEDLPDYDCCTYEDESMYITCCLAVRAPKSSLPPGCHSPQKMGTPECLPKGCPPTDGFVMLHECMEFGCNVGSRCTAHGAEDKKCCPFLVDGKYITCCPMLHRKRSMFFPVPKVLSQERRNEISKLGGWNCIEMGCVAGQQCLSDGLESEVCKKKTTDAAVITCCESLPRPEGCNYIVRSGMNYDCIEIGCKPGSKCKTKESLDDICCPYNVRRQRVTCCLRRRED